MLLTSLFITSQGWCQVSHSVLSEGHWVKIRVENTGICKISYEELVGMGLSPENIRVYGYGGAMLSEDLSDRFIDDIPAVPIYIHRQNAGTFGKGDYILFYVTGCDSWQFAEGRFTHKKNTYSSYGYYFLSDDAGEPKLIDECPMSMVSVGNVVMDVNTYDEHIVHEQELVNLIDINGQSGGGKSFYGESFGASNPLTLTIPFVNAVEDDKIYVRCDLGVTSFDVSNIRVNINGDEEALRLRAVNRNGSFSEQAVVGLISRNFPKSENGVQRIRLSITSNYSTPLAYLNYIEMVTKCRLSLSSSFLAFRSTENIHMDTVNRYHISGCSPTVEIWDVTDLDSIRKVSTTYSEGTVSFVGSNRDKLREYVAIDVNGNDWVHYEFVGTVSNQDLRKLDGDYDMVILTPEELASYAAGLGRIHELHDDMKVLVVRVGEVYNEFSSGTPDATAYRRFAKMLYERGEDSGRRLSHLLLFGDGSFDNRNLLGSISGCHYLLTHQADNSVDELSGYVSDDYFGMLKGSGEVSDSRLMQIAVGRLPINTPQEAEEAVEKIRQYVQAPHVGSWKNQLLFLADDGDHGQHTRSADEAAEMVRQKNRSLIINKVYLDAYNQVITAAGEEYPMARTRLLNLISSGILFFDYCGHGSSAGAMSEKVIIASELSQLRNSNLGFWMFATCSFSHFDSGKRSGGEYAVLNPHGGAIGMLSASRTVYANQNDILNKYLCDTLFSRTGFAEMSIGRATQYAKNRCVLSGSHSVIENSQAYVLLGDPAIKLQYSGEYGIRMTSSRDTIRALDLDTLRGYITTHATGTPDGDTVHDFNGKVNLILFDKISHFQTYDNDETDVSKKQVVSFTDYSNTLFRGTTDVRDGVFSLVYRVPKDIKYNFGGGRIVGYAFDSTTVPQTSREAMGYFEDFTVGGSSSSVLEDNEGPTVTIYLNSPAFKEGEATFETPRFYADVFDESGINTSGSGIGHDMLLTIDNDVNQTYTMNEYYQSNDGSYQDGRVGFLLPELREGRHSLSFRVWDLLNNSTTTTLSFRVVKNMRPNLFNMKVYPNPVSRDGVLYFSFDYDRNEYLCEIEIEIYNIAGQCVYRQTTDNSASLRCDLSRSNFTSGLYTYRFKIKTFGTGATTEVGKIIVK